MYLIWAESNAFTKQVPLGTCLIGCARRKNRPSAILITAEEYYKYIKCTPLSTAYRKRMLVHYIRALRIRGFIDIIEERQNHGHP